jgi:hypothetical protein
MEQKYMVRREILRVFLISTLIFGSKINSQNIFSGEPVQVVGQMNGYSTASSSNSIYRTITVNSGNPTDGRGQWVKTYNVQSSGGDFSPINMTGGGSNGFLFISGPSGNRFQNKWTFSGTSSGLINNINNITAFNSGNDMGLNMSTTGRYTFVFNDAGYTTTNAKYYIAYTTNAPITVSRNSQTLNFDRSSSIGITTSSAPSSGENIYVRYTTNSDFNISSTIIQATGSNTNWTASIPPQSIGSTVRYFIFTSTIPLNSLGGFSEIDKFMSVLNFDDNNANNYSYTLTSSFTSSATGNFSDPNTWGGTNIFNGASYTIANSHEVTVNTNVNVSILTINSGGNLVASDATPRTITISNGGSITNNGTFNAGTGTVAFAGTGSVLGTVGFNNVTLAGGVNFGSASTINGTLSINAGGFVNTNAPTYASGSTLLYNIGGAAYGRSSEWSSTSGQGYPHHVQISNNTTLNLNNNSNIARQMAGNLIIDSGSTLSMENMTNGSFEIGLQVLGDILNSGNLNFSTTTERIRCTNFTNNSGATTTLSSNIGGDLEITGNLTKNGTFNSNSRAVFFTGSGVQQINSLGSLVIDYLVSNKPSGSIQLQKNLLCEGPNGGNAISLTNASDILDLNGFTATFGKSGVTSVFAGNGSIKGGGTSSIVLLGTGNFGNIRMDQTIPGDSNILENLTLNRTSSGVATLANTMILKNTLTLTNGNLNSNGNLILASDANNTARLAAVGVGAGVTGNVTTERYLPAKRAWRLLASPVKGTTNHSVFANWQNNGTDNGRGLLLWHPSPVGTATPTSSNSGLFVGAQPNIYNYVNGAWTAVTNTNTTYVSTASQNNAFMVFVTGPHASSNFTSTSAVTTSSASGQLITGNVNHNIVANQFTLLGNPYASPINPVSLVSNNSGSKLWMLDPSVGLGAYITYDGNWVPEAPSGNDAYIQSGQGFFVRSTQTNFNIAETDKIAGNSNTWFAKQSVQNANENKIRVLLDKQINNEWQLADGILSVSGNNYSNDVDAQDALKVTNFNENIQFRNGTNNLAIEYQNLPTATTEQPIRLTGTIATSYRLRVRTEGFVSSDVQPILQDTQSGTNHLITTDGTTIEIPFTGVVSTTSNPDNRFKIVYQQVLGVEQPNYNTLQVYPNPVTQGQFVIALPNSSEVATYEITNYLGQIVQKGNLTAGNTNVSIASQAVGVYLVRVQQNGEVYTTKIVKK